MSRTVSETAVGAAAGVWPELPEAAASAAARIPSMHFIRRSLSPGPRRERPPRAVRSPCGVVRTGGGPGNGPLPGPRTTGGFRHEIRFGARSRNFARGGGGRDGDRPARGGRPERGRREGGAAPHGQGVFGRRAEGRRG